MLTVNFELWVDNVALEGLIKYWSVQHTVQTLLVVEDFSFCLAWMCFRSLFWSGTAGALKNCLQSITRPMVDNTGKLLHSTFSPWIDTENMKEKKNSYTSTHLAKMFFPMVVASSLPTPLRKCSLLALSQQLSLERLALWKNTLYFLPLFTCLTFCCSETLTLITAIEPIMKFSV